MRKVLTKRFPLRHKCTYFLMELGELSTSPNKILIIMTIAEYSHTCLKKSWKGQTQEKLL